VQNCIHDVNLYGDLRVLDRVHGIIVFVHGSGSSRYRPWNQSVARYLRAGGVGKVLFDPLTAEEERVAARLGSKLCVHEERSFEDGEFKVRPLESVRHEETVVIQSLYSDGSQSVNDKLRRLLFFIGALKDAGAASSIRHALSRARTTARMLR
jgi:hypothetical protein